MQELKPSVEYRGFDTGPAAMPTQSNTIEYYVRHRMMGIAGFPRI